MSITEEIINTAIGDAVNFGLCRIDGLDFIHPIMIGAKDMAIPHALGRCVDLLRDECLNSRKTIAYETAEFLLVHAGLYSRFDDVNGFELLIEPIIKQCSRYACELSLADLIEAARKPTLGDAIYHVACCLWRGQTSTVAALINSSLPRLLREIEKLENCDDDVPVGEGS